MATLVLSAAGTAIAGPIGGSIGSFIGSQIDAQIFGPPDREGPRLEELKVTTSSYGTPMPRHFGRMRAAGTLIWATDLKETSEETGGKGQPSVTNYSYSASFAVALASRPIARLGRVWADGNLLRGAAGDLKFPGELRMYRGLGDQKPDPLIASAEGNACPAFRGIAYCVFEDLALADFGNRIPSLTFEIIADNGTVSLTDLLTPLDRDISADRPLSSLEGYSDEGGAIVDTLASIDRVYPLSSNATKASLTFTSGNSDPDLLITLPEAVVDHDADGFGKAQGRSESIRADETRVPAGMRYYDVDRDYQAGLQRAGGRAIPGRNRVIEFPGALRAAPARKLADDAAERARRAQDRLSYRIAEIDPRLVPGQVVSVPGRQGRWQVEAWEWRETGVELELLRLPYRKAAQAPTDAGRSLPQLDLLAGPTLLEAYELPWDGTGPSDQPQVFAAASASTAGWRGAALYAQEGSALTPIGATGSTRAIVGALVEAIRPGESALIDRHTRITVQLASEDFSLDSCSLEELAEGHNRALVGGEVIQFANAAHLGEGAWQLSTLLRGRGGTEYAARSGHDGGSSFVLLDGRPSNVDHTQLAGAGSLAAIGIADNDPVSDAITNRGITIRPLSPVHAKVVLHVDGALDLSWVRRARGAWTWTGTVDAPLVEQSELYEVGVGDTKAPALTWQVSERRLVLDSATVTLLRADHPGAAVWVRQIGTHARSHPTLLTIID